MANAKKCDRCNRLYEIYDGIPVTEKGFKYNVLQLHNSSVHKTYDLCPDCMGRIVAFLITNDGRSCENCVDKYRDVCECDVLMNNWKPKNCKTCKYDGMNLDVCMGCTDDNYQMWKEKDDG